MLMRILQSSNHPDPTYASIQALATPVYDLSCFSPKLTGHQCQQCYNIDDALVITGHRLQSVEISRCVLLYDAMSIELTVGTTIPDYRVRFLAYIPEDCHTNTFRLSERTIDDPWPTLLLPCSSELAVFLRLCWSLGHQCQSMRPIHQDRW
ncbi:hypothetical protein BC629DRAFT_530140 [Irpex lacteus]|nr:hypothetical protein BC629DRAFT_530140 [Irpex lacteus]